MANMVVPLHKILDDEFITSLAKSADLYKIGSNSILDPEEIRIGLKVVPRAVMSMLISELAPMEINSSKDIQLPFGKNAYIRLNKNAADDFTGSVYSAHKLVYSFMNRSIPGLGIILLSTFELYNMEELSKPHKHEEDIDKKVQKLIDERMELHSLVNRVVEDKMDQREAVHKLVLARLNEELQREKKKAVQIAEVRKIQESSTPQSDPYFRGMTNGIEVANTIANGTQPNFIDVPKVAQNPTMSEGHGPGPGVGPIDVKPKDLIKKDIVKKELPLKKFLDRKKPKQYNVEMAKSEVVDCGDCGQTIFGSSGFSGCICYGQDQNRKIWIKKTEGGVQLKFSRGWDQDNIEQLLETLRKNNGKH